MLRLCLGVTATPWGPLISGWPRPPPDSALPVSVSSAGCQGGSLSDERARQDVQPGVRAQGWGGEWGLRGQETPSRLWQAQGTQANLNNRAWHRPSLPAEWVALRTSRWPLGGTQGRRPLVPGITAATSWPHLLLHVS